MPDCIFCSIVNEQAQANLVYKDSLCMAFMDLYPMRPGHVLVIPRQHVTYLTDLDKASRSHLFEVANQIVLAQKACGIPCDGNNIFINDGPAANQHVPHVHVHVLPREQGDLHKTALAFTTRYLNYFGQQSKRKKLQLLADQISRCMPQQVG